MAVYPAQWTIEGGKCPLQRTLLCTKLFLPVVLEHQVLRKFIQDFNYVPHVIATFDIICYGQNYQQIVATVDICSEHADRTKERLPAL